MTRTALSPEIEKLIGDLLGPRPEIQRSLGTTLKAAGLGALSASAGIRYAKEATGRESRDTYDATAQQLSDYIIKRVPLIKKDYAGPEGAVPTDADAYQILRGELGIKPYGGPFSLDQTVNKHIREQTVGQQLSNQNTRVQQLLESGRINVRDLTQNNPELAMQVLPIARARGGKMEKEPVTTPGAPNFGQEQRTGFLTFRTPEEEDVFRKEQLQTHAASVKTTKAGDVTEEERFAYTQERDQLEDFDKQQGRMDSALAAMSGSDNKLDQFIARVTAVQSGQPDPTTGMSGDAGLANLRQQTNEEKLRLKSNLSTVSQIVNPPELQNIVSQLSPDSTEADLRQTIYDFQAKRYPFASKDEKRRDRIRQLVDNYFSLLDYLIKLDELEKKFAGGQ